MFDCTKEDLIDILRAIDAGKLQYLNSNGAMSGTTRMFDVSSSVAKGYHVGALLTLQSGVEVKFKPRLIEGVPTKQVEPNELLLDGQQRMTSLYQVAFSTASAR